MEGILVFHEQRVRNMMNMKIFVDAGLLLLHFIYRFKFFSHLLLLHDELGLKYTNFVRHKERKNGCLETRGKLVHPVFSTYLDLACIHILSFVQSEIPCNNLDYTKSHHCLN